MKWLYKILYVASQFILLGCGKVIGRFLKPNPQPQSVLYLAAFFPGNAGYHWRVQKWAEELEKEGFKVVIGQAINKSRLQDYSRNSYRFLAYFFIVRFFQVLKAHKFQTVIVRRELLLFNQYGNHSLEKLLRKLCANVILDIDDDLAASKSQPYLVQSLFGKWMSEDGNSFRNSFQYYDRFIVASNYLKQYVLTHGNMSEERVTVIPTCVDYDQYEPKKYVSKELLTLGWIGNTNNLYLLKQLLPTLDKLAKNQAFELLVISGEEWIESTSFPVRNVNWSLENEVENIKQIDIGLMPLDDSDESKGKGGFKLIQYMGLGVVSIASAVTINKDIVDNGSNSFLYQTEEELVRILQDIFKGTIDLRQMSHKARTRIAQDFSFAGNRDKYLQIVKSIRS